MNQGLDLAAVDRPTILEIWEPTCLECRAMQSDLDEVAEEFAARVDLTTISATEELETVRRLGVKGTPTLIGVREGTEVFRVTGRRSRTDLRELFEGVAEGVPVRRVSRQDVALRLTAGLALMGIGLAGGPAWPLVGLGTALLTYAITPLMRERRG